LKPIRLAGFVQASRELGLRLHELREAKRSSFSESLSFLLDYGAACSDDQLAESRRLLEQASEAIRSAVGAGVLLLPTAPQTGFLHGSRAPANQADFTALASISGLPALSIPAGTDEEGMPVAVQLVGAAGNEIGLVELARRLEPHLGGFVPPPIF
jgi:aspartyl-tRNA(Asn)/glutamyl-tRNA(Gln) amidotransferase subunit A